MTEHHIHIPRTARYYTLGEPGEHIRQIWYVLHGYGQLARRFLREFQPLDDSSRLVVAPEALSRFYLGGTKSHVGASWMTKECRLEEIEDYIGYLDALHAEVISRCELTDVRIFVLGFSQGAATAARWAINGNVSADELILWGGMMPPDIDLQASSDALCRLRLSMVLGTSDEYADPDVITRERERLQEHDITYRWIEFDGGHRIDAPVLLDLAAVAALA